MQNGATPLHVASKNGHAEVCRVLIAANASLEAKFQVSIDREIFRTQTFTLGVEMHKNLHFTTTRTMFSPLCYDNLSYSIHAKEDYNMSSKRN